MAEGKRTISERVYPALPLEWSRLMYGPSITPGRASSGFSSLNVILVFWNLDLYGFTSVHRDFAPVVMTYLTQLASARIGVGCRRFESRHS